MDVLKAELSLQLFKDPECVRTGLEPRQRPLTLQIGAYLIELIQRRSLETIYLFIEYLYTVSPMQLYTNIMIDIRTPSY